jgi:hypothetical protein
MAVPATPAATTTAWLGDDAEVDAGLAVGGIQARVGKAWPARERSPNAATSWSRSAQMRLTSFLLVPL